MGTVKIRLSNGNMKRTATLEVSSTDDVPKVLDHIFAFMTGRELPSSVTLTAEVLPRTIPVPVESPEQPPARKEERPKQLPRINDNRTLGVNLGEMFPGLADLIQEAADAEAEGKNVPGRSGIKFSEEGVPLLRVQYFCRDLNCQYRGVRFVRDGSAYCKCHECGTPLGLRPASREQPQNEQGNFFMADQLYVEGMSTWTTSST